MPGGAGAARIRGRGAPYRAGGRAYDGSRESGLALDVAAEVAALAGVALRIVVVAERHAVLSTPAAAELVDVVERSAREAAEHLLDEAAARVSADVSLERLVAIGEAGAALAAAVRTQRDLLVVGSRRYGPARSVLVGTVGHHLAHSATSPVLVVPRGIETGGAGELLDTSTAG